MRLTQSYLLLCIFSLIILPPLNVTNAQTNEISSVRDIQRALIWTGHYQGLADGEIGPLSRKAMSEFLTSIGPANAGRISDRQIVVLLERAAEARKTFKFQHFAFDTARVQIGLPTKLFDKLRHDRNAVRLVSSANPVRRLTVFPNVGGKSAVKTLLATQGLQAKWYENLYKVDKPNLIVFSGTIANAETYFMATRIRGTFSAFLFQYDRAQSENYAALVTAMASSMRYPVERARALPISTLKYPQ